MIMHRWAFLKELVPPLLILAVLDYSFFDGKMLAWQPSPLWLPILLIAPRRGSVAGFTCGLAAAAIYLWFMSEQGYLWQDLLHREPDMLIRPGLFLFFGTYLGILSESQIRRMEFFRDKANALTVQLDSSEVKRTELERDRIEIEKRVAGQGETLLTLNDSFKKLGAASTEEELLHTLVVILLDESKAESCGIWRVSRGHSRLVAGRFGGDAPAIALAVGKKRKTISAADWSLEEDVPPGADLAALVMDDESQRLVVALADIPFVRLTRSLSLRVGLLSEQAGLVLGALRDREVLRLQATMDTESGLVSETYLRRRITEEVELANRHKTQLSLLACSITGIRGHMQERLETALSCPIRSCIRFSDGLVWFPQAAAFVMVLPQCDENGAAVVMRKIEANIEMLDLKDEQGHRLYELAWSIYACDGSLKGDAIFSRLFSGLRGGAAA